MACDLWRSEPRLLGSIDRADVRVSEAGCFAKRLLPDSNIQYCQNRHRRCPRIFGEGHLEIAWPSAERGLISRKTANR